ncbi:hypothetical protein BOTBODRAFT_184803 [Botryobasidium botryosum FD-172 SS1]|uniref:F-box domain-containing protein n=1 Tax=Botryobasidium botryosum (strain FD-172 SS1) TaxID=930990 RepID=A0A067MTS6_BOTB1|nr:hypothetical protein BOTBODRAFT_184803 [Botryobasidium botryosum FD-172 SS1]
MEHENSAILPQLFQDLVADIQSRLACEPGEHAHLDAASDHKNQVECAGDALEKKRAMAHLALDAFTLYAKRRISRLGTRQNQLKVTYRIPNEILSYILELSGKGETTGVDVLNLSHVSRRWRQVALETPRLWTSPLMFPSEFVDICAARSKNLPLNISSGRSCAGRVREVLPYQPRWRRLCLSYSPKDSKLVKSFLSVPAPMLETLQLRFSDPGNMDCASDSKILHRNPFGGDTPRLREVFFSGVFLPFASPIFSGLRKLSLDDMQFDKVNTIYQLLRALGACPCMESLTFGEYLQFGPDVATHLQLPSTMPFVSLPRLRSLTVGQLNAEPTLVFILSRLTTPPNSTLSITVSSAPDDLGLASIVPLYSGPQYNLQNLPFVSQLKVNMRAYGGRASCVLHGTGDSDLASRSGFTFIFWMRSSRIRDAFTELFKALGVIFPMSHLQRLCIDLPFDGVEHTARTNSTAFIEFLGRHPSITTIALSKCAPSFIEGLIVTSTRRACPALEELSIYESSVGDDTLRKLVASRSTTGPDQDGSLAPLAPQTIGGLRRLRIVACKNVTAEALSDLRVSLEVATNDDMKAWEHTKGSKDDWDDSTAGDMQ